MSNSTDSLRKKVCVTVFLDELFEEVPEEERKDLKQVEELPEPRVKVTEETYVEQSRINSSHDQQVNVRPANVDADRPRILLRPIKHRRESKFSEKSYDSFKKELSKYGYGSANRRRSREPAESTLSDSDFDLDEILEVDKWGVSRSSFSEASEVDMTEGSFLSIKPARSLNRPAKRDCRPGEKPNSGNEKGGLFRNQSTQFDSASDVSAKEGQTARVDALAWKGIQQQVQLFLSKMRPTENETCEGDRLRSPDLKSILEECLKKEESSAKDFAELRGRVATNCNNSELSDSYTCVFPHNKQTNRAPKVERVGASSKRSLKSDLSDPDLYAKEVDLQKDSVLRYALKSLGLKSKENVPEGTDKGHVNPTTVQSTSREMFFDGKTPKVPLETDEVIKTVTHLANKTVLETMLSAGQEEEVGRERNHMDKRLLSVEDRNKNFAEGDTFGNLHAKEISVVCDEMLMKEEPKVVHNEIIVNLAEIKLDRQDMGIVNVSPKRCPPPEFLPVVLFEKSPMTDAAESEIFADSEHFSESEVVLDKCFDECPVKNELCVVEFEDKLSHSKIVRRIKTVEILSSDSLKDMKDISTEVILVCENVKDSQVHLEAWQSKDSSLKSITDMGQCYLKDSKDSAMYLIEIPFQFTSNAKEKSSEQLFKTSDSD